MAQTPTIHAPKGSYSSRDAVTACGRKSGETTTDPATITCQAVACGEKRVAHERKVALAAVTKEAFTERLVNPDRVYEMPAGAERTGVEETEGYRYTYEGTKVTQTVLRDVVDNEARRERRATLTLTAQGDWLIESPSLGFFDFADAPEQAECLYQTAKNLMDAAQKARAIIEARAYMAEYEATKAGA